MSSLPKIDSKDFNPTRDYLKEVSLVLGSLQRLFIEPEEHLWQHGLEVSMRGLVTQEFEIKGQPIRATLDLIRYKVRLGDKNWSLHKNSPKDIYEGLQAWLKDKDIDKHMEEPNFSEGEVLFDTYQADKYAEALWWSDLQFKEVKKSLNHGLLSPLYLYPHHFDLSLSWYPYHDDRQLSLGFSTADNINKEAYYYLSLFPNTEQLKRMNMPMVSKYLDEDFKGWILNYNDVRTSQELLSDFMNLSEAKGYLT